MTKRKGAQTHPKGPLITVSADERKRLKVRREALDWTQRDLATRMGVTAATISNIEGTRSGQVKRAVYAKWRRVLARGHDLGPDADQSDEAFRRLVDGAANLDGNALDGLADLAQKLRKPG